MAACLPGRPAPTFLGAPDDEAAAYLNAWERNDLGAQRVIAGDMPPNFEADHEDWRRQLGISRSRFELLRTERANDGAAIVMFKALHTLRGLGEWEVQSQLRFEKKQSGWRLRWTPAVLHPAARAGDRFARTRAWGPRADLLDAHGRSLTRTPSTSDERVTVGVQPRRVNDPTAVLQALHIHLDVDEAVYAAAVAKAGSPDAFVPIIDLPPERYSQVRAPLAAVPGIFFRKTGTRGPMREGFAAHTLGRVGPVTAEVLEDLSMPYQVGDVVGLTGLERALERTLAGRPAGEVSLIRASGARERLHRFDGTQGRPAPTTLHLAVQEAAEAALQGVTASAALVAVEVSTGNVVAVASRPLSDPFHRALGGLYPPGSTFKIVTAEALFRGGLRPETRVQCPGKTRIGNADFHNFENEAFGSTTFRLAFAHSCNTTVILQAAKLGPNDLHDAAARFGFGVTYRVGLTAPDATFPDPQNEAESAAASIGQGRALATPLHMASVAAALGAGVWRAPRLLPGGDRGEAVKLTAGAAQMIQGLMKAAVREGTAKAAAAVPGLLGKTGTAEFGTAVPPATHAWFVGLYEGYGFAVLVENGGVGGRVAVPLAVKFAQALTQGR